MTMILFFLVFFVVSTSCLLFVLGTDMYNGNKQFREDKNEWRKMLLTHIRSLIDLNNTLVNDMIKLQASNTELRKEHESLNNELINLNKRLSDLIKKK